MVLKPDQQRVCMMLKETITLLCKNGLAFKKKFCIDAVIGITLDDEDMFHVSVSEIIKSSSDDDSDTTPSSCELGEAQRKRRKRHKADGDDLSDGLDVNSECGNDSEPELSDNTSMTIKEIEIKGEQAEEEKQDIIFVKQELGLDWSQSQESGANISNSQNNSNLRSVPDMNMITGSTGPNFNLWPVTNLQSPHQYNQSASATITTADTNILTAATPGENVHSSTEQSLIQQSVCGGSRRYICTTCGKTYTCNSHLSRHVRTIHFGIYPYKCQICGKGFVTKDHLNGHTAKHTGKGCYTCDFCPQVFAWKSAKFKHIKMKHSRQ